MDAAGLELLRRARDILDASDFEDALTVQDVITRDLGDGQRYTFTHLFENVDSGTTVSVYANNPAGEETPIVAGFRQIIAEGTVRGSVYANVTQDTSGTAQNARNDLVRPDDETTIPTAIEWETGGTYSDRGEGVDILAPGGTSVGTRGGAVGIQAIARTRPGTNLLWELESQSNQNDILFTVVYSEIR